MIRLRHIILASLLLNLILRLPTLWIHILDIDEAIWAICGRMLLEGYIPYIDFVDNKPIGIMAYMAAIFKVFGSYNLLYVHLVTIIVTTATAVIIFLTARQISNSKASAFACLLYSLFMTAYIPKVISTNIETLMNLPLSLAVFFLILSYRKHTSKLMFFSGFSLAVACLFKYQSGVVGILITTAILFKPPHRRTNENFLLSIIKSFTYFSIGIFIPVLVNVLYLYSCKSLNEFLLWTITDSMTYIKAGSSTLHLGKKVAIRFGTFLFAALPLWTLAIKQIAARIQKGSERETLWYEWIIIFWFLISTLAVFTGWRLYGHYFLLWLPALSILAGKKLDALWNKWSVKNYGRSMKIFTISGIAILIVGSLLPRYFLNTVNRMVGEDNPFDYIPIAKAVTEGSSPDDKIFVWGHAPAVYYFSKRNPASRFPASNWLTGRCALPGNPEGIDLGKFLVPGVWKLWLEDMEKNKPAYIIDTAPAALHDSQFYPIENYKTLSDYIKKYYVFEKEVNKNIFYRRKEK